MTTEQSVFEIDLGENGGLLKFYSREEIKEFTMRERQFYAWLDQSSIAGEGQNNLNRLLGRPDNRVDALPTDFIGMDPQLQGLIRAAFIENHIPLSTTPRGKFIENMRANFGPRAAGGALAYFTNSLTFLDLKDTLNLTGVIAAVNFKTGIDPTTAQATKQALDDLTERYEKWLNEANEKRNGIISEFEQAKVSARRLMRVFLVTRERRLIRFRDASQNTVQGLLEELSRTKATYQELMKIKAPVDYWREKGIQHRAAAKGYRTLLLWFAAIGGAVLVGALSILSAVAIYLSSLAQQQFSVSFVILATIGVVVTTMVFWAARVLVRLFMSEHHLAIDADERATMAMTYLALTETKAAEEKDRAIILASLFRPTTDGIVKDDAAPEFGAAGMLSKLLERR